MNDDKRIDELKKSLKKDIYTKIEEITFKNKNDDGDTRKLSNILEGYVGQIEKIHTNDISQFEGELKLILDENVDVEISEKDEILIKKYNDHLHDTIEAELTKNLELDDLELEKLFANKNDEELENEGNIPVNKKMQLKLEKIKTKKEIEQQELEDTQSQEDINDESNSTPISNEKEDFTDNELVDENDYDDDELILESLLEEKNDSYEKLSAIDYATYFVVFLIVLFSIYFIITSFVL